MVERLREVMTAAPRCLSPTDTVGEAARMMRDENIGDVLVCVDDRLTGIVTDRDLVVRALAEQAGDPRQTRLGDIASKELVMLSPDDSVEEAVALMRGHAIRRIPVCENGRPVGVVALGDLAVERDWDSALADISAAPANV